MAENAFGVLSNRFRFLRTVVHAEPRRVANLLKAACVLHNFLNAEPVDVTETGAGNTEQTFFPMLPCKVRYNSKATHVRDELRTLVELKLYRGKVNHHLLRLKSIKWSFLSDLLFRPNEFSYA